MSSVNSQDKHALNTKHRGAVAWMAQNPVAANLLMLLVLIAGTMSIFTIKKEVFPTFPADSLLISVPYPGSSPEEVEEGVILKIEEEVQGIEGVDEINSTASEGAGQIIVELDAGVDVQDVINKIKVRVDGISSFPGEVEQPIIEERLSSFRVLNLTLYGPLTEHQLKELADVMRDELLQLPGITQVNIGGTRDYEMTIEISDRALQQYNMRFSDVLNIIRNQSRDLPGGKLRTENRSITLRSEGQAYTEQDFAKLVLLSRPDGTTVKLGDVANIKNSFEDNPLFSEFNLQPAITLQIDRVGDQSALEISKIAREYMANKISQLPEGVEIAAWSDRTVILKGRIQLLLKSAAQGALLVLITLALFLRPSVAFWVVIGVPFCFLGALIVMDATSVSINVLSLFAFILVLGIVVDDAIVTAESAYTTLEREDHGQHSIIRGVQRVTVATIFGVLTTILAFLPMLFIEEGIGRFFTAAAKVVIICLVFSIIETKFILPAHLSHLKIKPREKWNRFDRFQQSFSQALTNFAEYRYKPVLKLALKYRYATVALFISLLIIAITFPRAGFTRVVFFPNVPSDFISIQMEMPKGTPYQTTFDYGHRIERAAMNLNTRYREATGQDKDVLENLEILSRSDSELKITVDLIPSTERDITSVELASWLREDIGVLPGLKSMSFDANAGAGSVPIDIQLQATSLDLLRDAAADVKEALGQYSGVFDIRDTFDSGNTEVDIQLTDEGRALGLGQVELARQVRQAFFGTEIQRIQRGRHEVRVYARFPAEERNSLDKLKNMWIRLPNGQDVPFSVVGKAVEKPGISTIKRINRQRVVNVQADVDKSRVEPGKVLEELKKGALKEIEAKYPGLSFDYSGEAEQQRSSMEVLILGTLVVLVMIYAALAIPLKSYYLPLVIMSVIPFGITGAIAGHFILGKEISIISIIGIVALIGIVVNDSLVLVDFINHQVKDYGQKWRDAVATAGTKRFRAVVLTSVTTFVGLLPIQLETSIQAQFLKPMAISVAFGVLFATIVTLFLVPSLCYITDDIGKLWMRLWKKAKRGLALLLGRTPAAESPDSSR